MAGENENDKIVMGPLDGASIASRYIKIEGQSTGTLAGDNVDDKLSKANRLIDFAEKFSTKMNSDTVDNLAPGAIRASLLYIEIYEIPLAMYLENMCFDKEKIDKITIYKTQEVSKKITPIDETTYENCMITGIERSASKNFSRETQGDTPITFKAWIRFLKRTRNQTPYKQTGELAGNLPSQISFPEGVLQPAGGGGGGGGGGDGGGGGGGGEGGGGGF